MKKHFTYTKPGKVLLFIFCGISLFLFLWTLYESSYLKDNNYYYADSPEDLQRVALIRQLQSDAPPLIRQSLRDIIARNTQIAGVPLSRNLTYQLMRYDSDEPLLILQQPGFARSERTLCLVYMIRNTSQQIYYREAIDIQELDDPALRASFPDGFIPVIFMATPSEPMSSPDKYAFQHHLIAARYTFRYFIWVGSLLFAAAAIWLYILLLKASARRPDSPDLHPWKLDPVPFDLLLLADAVLYGAIIIFPAEQRLFANLTIQVSSMPPVVIWQLIWTIGFFLAISMSAAARIKQKTLFSRMLLVRSGKKLAAELRKLPLIWKTVLATVCFFLVNGLLLSRLRGYVYSSTMNRTVSIILLLLWNLLAVVTVFRIALHFKKLEETTAKLAAGQSAAIDSAKLVHPLRKAGENLNHVSGGMQQAIETALRSERMKTELITNVSHDIKTPLTSIISYTELLKKEEGLSEQGKESVEVLARQSERLKRLTEDLVEASKASAGVLDVELVPCEAAVFVTQSAGEYEERLQEAGLTLITKVPDEPLQIRADGRRMQRIFDNLMNNIAKYSLPGSRVYLDLERKGNRAVFSFKNTSREALNIRAEDLLERFVRGDSSRHTEGNGLGLAIAQSLAELQGATLVLQIDGDLFKALLSFPLLKTEKTGDGSLS